MLIISIKYEIYEERIFNMVYRYYSTLRPASNETYPRSESVIKIKNFDCRKMVGSILRFAYGYIDYSELLTEEEIEKYGLVREY